MSCNYTNIIWHTLETFHLHVTLRAILQQASSLMNNAHL